MWRVNCRQASATSEVFLGGEVQHARAVSGAAAPSAGPRGRCDHECNIKGLLQGL